MSGRRKAGKASIHMSKPEPPPFLQRIREQIVANEGADRIERMERKRKERPPGRMGQVDDDPTVVKVGDDDLTEEEYKRMKLELETQYKLDDDEEKRRSSNLAKEELNVDALIQSRLSASATRPATSRDTRPVPAPSAESNSPNRHEETTRHSYSNKSRDGRQPSSTDGASPSSSVKKATPAKSTKTLSYGSSSSDDDE